jgi:hypothetical protein
MNERLGLEGMVTALTLKKAMRDGAELAVDQRDESLKRLLVTVAPSAEQFRDAFRWESHNR